MASKYETFAALHVPGNPVILYNIWDVGSALAVVAAGAKALATGSHPVADAHGWPDRQQLRRPGDRRRRASPVGAAGGANRGNPQSRRRRILHQRAYRPVAQDADP